MRKRPIRIVMWRKPIILIVLPAIILAIKVSIIIIVSVFTLVRIIKRVHWGEASRKVDWKVVWRVAWEVSRKHAIIES